MASTLNTIRNAIWGDASAGTGNLIVNAGNTSSPELIYDGNREVYLNAKTGQIMNTAGAIYQHSGHQSSAEELMSYPAHRLKMLSLRLRIQEGTFPKSFTDLHTALAGDKVYVFIVKGADAVTLEDNAGLFPSDALVTQIRLLME